jgi:cellulose synthase/poly-beta-1,6-N-acetylglucosamine synthase-like glycosyltransferase
MQNKKPHMFVTVFAAWALLLAWFHPRFWSLTALASDGVEFASIAYFVVFAEIAWLYGVYNIVLVIFAGIYKRSGASRYTAGAISAGDPLVVQPSPAVAVLYTTCNDFVEASAESCMTLDYPNYTLYMLDDSSSPAVQARIDAFAENYIGRVVVVRRPNRVGFKAGNLNHALANVAHEPLFAVVDADEILPPDFLSRLVPRLTADSMCGFVQANHRSRSDAESSLARDMGVGIDIHWKWHQPLRNEYGFVMFLGHGALIRRHCWSEVGGFPEIVSEDLGFAIAIRELGYQGLFAEDVVCLEEFPETVRAFRVRHVKWTRGTCEFLRHWMGRVIRARKMSISEKLDILFPTLNLPMTFFYFLFMINAQLLFTYTLGQVADLTIAIGSKEFVLPVVRMNDAAAKVFSLDFFFVTLATILAPILCFVLALYRKPWKLFKFLTHSTALYAALSPLTFVAVVGYAITGKARFLVTGDRNEGPVNLARAGVSFDGFNKWLSETHPDTSAVRIFELTMGIVFLVCAILGAQISFVGLSLAFLLLPVLHKIGWGSRFARAAIWVPFGVFLAGLLLGVSSVFGMQPVFFGYGFHF